jgi:hypothetical protein
LRERVRELERERVTVQQAAARLSITESAVRKRARKGDLRSEKVLEGNRERLYVFLDPDAEPFPEPFREKYMRSLEDRVKTLEDEVMRQQAIILSMSQSLRALTGAPEAPQGVEEAQEVVDLRPSTEGERETTRPPATSASNSRLGMSGWALAVGAIATLLSWFLFMRVFWFSSGSAVPDFFVILPVLVPLLSGLWAGSTKRPSLPWFSSPHRWLRRGGRSALAIAVFAAGVPSATPWMASHIRALIVCPQIAARIEERVAERIAEAQGGAVWVPPSPEFCLNLTAARLAIQDILTFMEIAAVLIFVAAAVASLAFMSGAFLGNALRRFGVLGTPKEQPQGEDEEAQEEEVWSPRKEARWGLAGTVIASLITAVASVVAAYLSSQQ